MNEVKLIQAQAKFKDKGIVSENRRLWVDLYPMEPESLLEVLRNNDKDGWFIFKSGESKIKEEEIGNLPDIQKEPENTKSPAQRLHAVLYRIWEQQGKQGEFRTYYERYMERLIDKLKEQLL